MTIRQWFNENNRYYTDPCTALDAGYSLKELAGEYEELYITKEIAAEYLMNDLKVWLQHKTIHPIIPPVSIPAQWEGAEERYI